MPKKAPPDQPRELTEQDKLRLFDDDILWLLEGLPEDNPKPKRLGRDGEPVMHDRRGRPLVVTKGVVRKMKQAYLYDFTDDEACNFAGISRTTWYEFRKAHPELADVIQHWRDDQIYMARRHLRQMVKDGDPESVRFMLKAKRKREFSTRIEHDGPDGNPIPVAAAVFSDEFEKRVKDYEPKPAEPPAEAPAPKVRRLAAGLKKLQG